MEIKQIVLEGRHVRLDPMSLDHVDKLCDAGLNASLWQFNPMLVRNREDMLLYVRTALKLRDEGTALPFVTIEKSGDSLVGSTRFGNIDRSNKRLEIGWTWIAPQWQKTFVNTEAKYLMLQHAFEVLGCVRVEFKTDSLNTKSRTALKGIGAKEEGILRNHMIMPGGRLRHSVYFSILDSEWEGVKRNLEMKLERNSNPGEGKATARKLY